MNIYKKAEQKGCYLESTCVNINLAVWDEIMKGARNANNTKAVKVALLAGVIDNEQAKMEIKNPNYNPYTHKVSENYVIYIHSCIEHFIKIN